MPRTIAVEYHVVRGVQYAVDVVIDDVLIAFRSSGIELSVTKGSDINTDPQLGGLNSFDRLLARYRAGPHNAGQIVVANRPRDGRFDFAGELLDLDLRGVAAIYAFSLYIAEKGDVGIAQTLAHEIGHMMDLGHEDISSSFTSAMVQADARTEDLDVAWKLAARESDALQQANEPSYFQKPIRPVRCYPFAHAARKRVNDLSDLLISPWGGPCTRGGGGLNDGRAAARPGRHN